MFRTKDRMGSDEVRVDLVGEITISVVGLG
jgi:hypothetical protein